jgi:lipopolysaccharide export system permease protein
MRISDRYIAKQVLIGTFTAVAVLACVLMLGNLFKKIEELLVDQNAPPEVVLRFALNVLPLSLMYTIPWGFLSAVLLVFGRLSSDQEITAFRVAGVSLTRLSLPVFAIGAALSMFCLWLNVNIYPRLKSSTQELLYEQAVRDPDSLLRPGIVQGNFRDDGQASSRALIERKDGGWVRGFHFYQIPEPGKGDRIYIHAERAALAIDHEKSQLRMKLENAYFETRKQDGSIEPICASKAEPLLIDLKDPKQRRKSRGAMSNEEIRAAITAIPNGRESDTVKMRMEITRRFSFSFASLAFAFIAVPLGLVTRRRETSGGLVLSLMIAALYFVITTLAEHSDTAIGANLVMWSPNVICVIFGLYLFRRARFK